MNEQIPSDEIYFVFNISVMPHYKQVWGRSTQYFSTLVLRYQFAVLMLYKSTCTHNCTQVVLKMKIR